METNEKLLNALIGMIKMYETELKPTLHTESGLMMQSLSIAKKAVKEAHGNDDVIETSDFCEGVKFLSKVLLESNEHKNSKNIVMEKKHTGNEWYFQNWVKVSGQGDVPTEIIADCCQNGRKVATLNFDSKDEELSSEKVRYNALLISKSPKLLESLKGLVNSVRYHSSNLDEIDHWLVTSEILIKKIETESD